MKIYKDIISSDEILTDLYKIIRADCAYQAEEKYICRYDSEIDIA
jgi:hypothetical protein